MQPNKFSQTPAQVTTNQGYPQARQPVRPSSADMQRTATPPQQRPAAPPQQQEQQPSLAVAQTAQGNVAASVRPDNRSAALRVIDEISPISFFGRRSRFDGKEGLHKFRDDDSLMEEGPWVVRYDMAIAIWVRFHGAGNPPDRVSGFIFDPSFQDTPRESLGDTDPSKWQSGLSGRPEDPWQREILILASAKRDFVVHRVGRLRRRGDLFLRGHVVAQHPPAGLQHRRVYPNAQRRVLVAGGLQHDQRQVRAGLLEDARAVAQQIPGCAPARGVAGDPGRQLLRRGVLQPPADDQLTPVGNPRRLPPATRSFICTFSTRANPARRA